MEKYLPLPCFLHVQKCASLIVVFDLSLQIPLFHQLQYAVLHSNAPQFESSEQLFLHTSIVPAPSL